jgi:hypothetical protein
MPSAAYSGLFHKEPGVAIFNPLRPLDFLKSTGRRGGSDARWWLPTSVSKLLVDEEATSVGVTLHVMVPEGRPGVAGTTGALDNAAAGSKDAGDTAAAAAAAAAVASGGTPPAAAAAGDGGVKKEAGAQEEDSPATADGASPPPQQQQQERQRQQQAWQQAEEALAAEMRAEHRQLVDQLDGQVRRLREQQEKLKAVPQPDAGQQELLAKLQQEASALLAAHQEKVANLRKLEEERRAALLQAYPLASEASPAPAACAAGKVEGDGVQQPAAANSSSPAAPAAAAAAPPSPSPAAGDSKGAASGTAAASSASGGDETAPGGAVVGTASGTTGEPAQGAGGSGSQEQPAADRQQQAPADGTDGATSQQQQQEEVKKESQQQQEGGAPASRAAAAEGSPSSGPLVPGKWSEVCSLRVELRPRLSDRRVQIAVRSVRQHLNPWKESYLLALKVVSEGWGAFLGASGQGRVGRGHTAQGVGVQAATGETT